MSNAGLTLVIAHFYAPTSRVCEFRQFASQTDSIRFNFLPSQSLLEQVFRPIDSLWLFFLKKRDILTILCTSLRFPPEGRIRLKIGHPDQSPPNRQKNSILKKNLFSEGF
jgi:hypothetical protein